MTIEAIEWRAKGGSNFVATINGHIYFVEASEIEDDDDDFALWIKPKDMNWQWSFYPTIGEAKDAAYKDLCSRTNVD